MCSVRLLAVFTIVPTIVLLAISFFVLFTVRKIEAQGLKTFGYILAALLWICAAVVLSTGIYIISAANPMVCNVMPGQAHQGQMQGCE